MEIKAFQPFPEIHPRLSRGRQRRPLARERAEQLEAALVARHRLLEVRVEHPDRAELGVVRVRHHVGAEQLDRLQRVGELRVNLRFNRPATERAADPRETPLTHDQLTERLGRPRSPVKKS